jgi:hypothetical protein
MAKLITCRNCGAEKIGPKNAKWPDGAPVIYGYFSCGPGYVVVKCHRCTNSFKLNAIQFNGLPNLTEAQYEEFLAPKPQLAVE